MIKKTCPNLFTVNEIYSDNVTQHLQPTLAAAWPKDWTYSVCMPAIAKDSDSAYHYTRGDYYGSAVIGRVPIDSWNGVEGYVGR
jgi:hypothetical protein